jgi:mRNA interferase MazF
MMKKMAAPTPKRGEVWLVDLGMVAKIRPCLVMSIPANHENDRVLATLIPHTTSTRGSRFEIAVSSRFLKPGAFDVQNVITIPPIKMIRMLGKLSSDEMVEVEAGLKFWLGLTE